MRDSLLLMDLPEDKFWNMTLNELERYAEAYNKKLFIRRRETANNLYTLGALIGRSVASYHSNNINYPSIEDLFPSYFNTEEDNARKEELVMQQSVANFLSFAQSYNKRYEGNINDNE